MCWPVQVSRWGCPRRGTPQPESLLPPMAQPSPSTQVVTPPLPGTVVADVETLLDFVGMHRLETAGKNANLPPAALPALNLRLSHPIVLDLKRALLRDYPKRGGLKGWSMSRVRNKEVSITACSCRKLCATAAANLSISYRERGDPRNGAAEDLVPIGRQVTGASAVDFTHLAGITLIVLSRQGWERPSTVTQRWKRGCNYDAGNPARLRQSPLGRRACLTAYMRTELRAGSAGCAARWADLLSLAVDAAPVVQMSCAPA
jgi:hypothetical protein